MSEIEVLFIIINKETGLIHRHQSKGHMAIFRSRAIAEKHAWRYGARNDNYDVVKYVPEEKK